MDLAGIKASTDVLVGQFPQIEAFIDAQLAKVTKTFNDGIAALQQAVKDSLQTVEETAGGTLKDITAERIEAVNDLHSVIDRFQINILPRKDPLA